MSVPPDKIHIQIIKLYISDIHYKYTIGVCLCERNLILRVCLYTICMYTQFHGNVQSSLQDICTKRVFKESLEL
jgi:hypothetical protein